MGTSPPIAPRPVGRPRAAEKMEKIGISLPAGLMREVRDVAAKNRQTLSGWIELAIRQRLNGDAED